MPKSADPSPLMHEPKTQAQYDHDSRHALAAYLDSTLGTPTEQFENFAKYAPRQNLARFLARYEIFKHIQKIQGSIVECGVLYGLGLMSFAKISTILEPYNFQRRIFGFDTFEGFPNIHPVDLEGRPETKASALKKGGFNVKGAYEDLQKAIEVYDLNRPLNHFQKVHLYQGDFLETGPKCLEEHPHLVISCLYLDFDIYEPTKRAIELFLPRIPKGGIIVFDELNEEQFPGETLAVLETMNLNQLRIQRFEFEPRISYVIIGD